MLQLSKCDMKAGNSLRILGRSGAASKNVVNSLCADGRVGLEFIRKIIDPSVYYIPMSSGSSSPVYRLRIGPDYRYAVVDAYGIHIGMDEETKEVYVADISWIYVKVSWLG
jgi:hypothetical protein